MNNRKGLLQRLYHPKHNNDLIFAEIKQNSGSIAQFKKNIKPALKHPYTRHLFKSNLFPGSLEDLKKGKILPSSNNLAGEIGWLLHSIFNNIEKLQLFIELKNEFENSFLLGDYERCETVINRIEDEVSLSFWSIEARLIIDEYKYGVESNWNRLSEYSKQTRDAFVLFFVENFSKKIERNISYFRFSDLFISKLEGLNVANLIEYFCFRLNYPSFQNYQNFPFFLVLEANSSLIDRYLILVDVLLEICKSGDPVFQSLTEEAIDELSVLKGDYRLIQIRALLNGYYEEDFLNRSSELIELFDLYTKGSFETCISKALILLKKRPTSVELFELYTKSLLYTDKGFIHTKISTIIDDILQNLYILYSLEGSHQDALGKLLKYSISFQDSSWGRQLLGIVTKHTFSRNNGDSSKYLFCLNSQLANPRLAEIDKSLVDSFQKNFDKSITYESLKNIVKGNADYFYNNQNIYLNKRFIYLARALDLSSKYEESIKHLENPPNDLTLSPIEIEEKVQLLYKAYLEKDNLEAATKLYVSENLRNKHLTFRLDAELLFDKIKNETSISSLIEVPIFMKMHGADSYDQYVAYDNYLNHLGLDKPSDIEIRNIDKDSLYLFFLYEVCRTDVMQYSLAFEGIDEVEAERQRLLRILVKEDRENEDEYIKEIAELTQSSKIRKAIREVDKGRITVNISQLRSIESSNIVEGFIRYQELLQFKKNNEQAIGVDISTSSIKKYIESLLDDKKLGEDRLTNDPAFISFKSLFLDIRDKFLLSKEYGLDGYLSTRIRHGTLENHIRSVFENYSLIADRDREGEYKEIDSWKEKLLISTAYQADLQSLLKRLSEKIDSIIQFLIQEQIQIYTDKYNQKPKALFNYNFSNEFLWVFFQYTQDNISNHDTFLDYVFNELQGHTETRLEKIRNYIKNDLSKSLLSELDSLQEAINEKIIASFPELNAAILSCRTEIQTELGRISDWFYLSNPTTNSVSDVETTLRTSVEITNSITPNHQIDATYFGNLDLPIYGALHIIYISRILLDNVVKHSGIGAEKLKVEISAELPNENTLRLAFSNELASNIDLNDLNDRLKDVKQKWLNKENFEMTNKEGGSGFDKIRRILAFDLKGSNYGFDFQIDDNSLSVSVDIGIRIETREET